MIDRKKIVNLVNSNFLLDQRSFDSLNSKGFGEKIGELFLLNINEVLFLLENKKIIVYMEKKKLTFKELVSNKKYNLNEYLVYKDLKSKGLTPKSGSKYGVPFRVYEKGMKPQNSHSEYLLDIIEHSEKIKVNDLLGKNRISHSTRKKLIIAIIDRDNSITYIENSWKKI